MTIANNYLFFTVAISSFRVFMYLIDIEKPAKVKVTPKAWEDPKVREIMISYCTTIRTFMAFRTGICFAASYLEESNGKFLICIVNLLLDIKLMHGMLTNFVGDNGKIAMVHQFNIPPLFLQSISLLAGIIFLGMNYIS
jgi:hypothetical protein